MITVRETFRVTSDRKSTGSGVRWPRIVIPALPFTNWVTHSKDFTFLNLRAPTYKMVLPDLPTSQDCCACHKGYMREAVLETVQSHTPWSSLSLLPILCFFAVFFSFLWSFSSFPQSLEAKPSWVHSVRSQENFEILGSVFLLETTWGNTKKFRFLGSIPNLEETQDLLLFK